MADSEIVHITVFMQREDVFVGYYNSILMVSSIHFPSVNIMLCIIMPSNYT